MSGSNREQAIAALSREFALSLDEAGTITWTDERAVALGLAAGTVLRAHALPGTELKIDALLAGPVQAWELALVANGQPLTVMCSTRAASNETIVVGSVVPQDYANAAVASAQTINQIVNLHRDLALQKQRLEESNLAIRSLHTELEQQADTLRTSAEVNSRLISGVSHELRTPLHSILGLSRLLLDGSDQLAEDQRTTLRFIRTSAEELSTMVNDMLDLARLDAGGTVLRAGAFELHDFLAAMRGTMQPLVAATDGRDALELVFDPAPNVPLETDQGKLAQVVRNLISNAIKFTPSGTVRVTATATDRELTIVVADTGIGIAPEDQLRIFNEFVQIDSPVQRAVRGTGLGLPLAKRLTEALRGTLGLESASGAGSTFTLKVPLVHPDVNEFRALQLDARQLDPNKHAVLVVEDDRTAVFVYQRYLSEAGFQILPARTTEDAREILRSATPSAILLDVMLEGEDTWNFLAELKREPRTRDIPVLVCTVMNRESQARALGADEFWLKPVDQDKLIRKLEALSTKGKSKVLVVDDDPAARYLVRKFLEATPYVVTEAADGATGVALAREQQPNVILLDFLLDNMTAFDVLDQLKSDPSTRSIPVIIVTSQALPLEARKRLGEQTSAILSKEHLSRELAINRIRDALRTAGISSTGHS